MKNFFIFIRSYRVSSKVNMVITPDLHDIIIGSMLGNRFYSTPTNNCDSIAKKKRLTLLERAQFNVSPNLKEILIGLLLGDLCAQKRSIKGNTYFHFEQGYIHKDYLFHLYSLFESYCYSEPVVSDRSPDKRTGKIEFYICIKFKYIYKYIYSILVSNLLLILYHVLINFIIFFIQKGKNKSL
jgi:hypothetical protein